MCDTKDEEHGVSYPLVEKESRVWFEKVQSSFNNPKVYEDSPRPSHLTNI